jgi:hypothetical protein
MKNKRLKKEFAKAFDWYEMKSDYGYSNPKKVYRDDCSWEEIFTEIGRLKANQGNKIYKTGLGEAIRPIN